MFIFAVTVFVISLLLFIFDWVDKTIVALLSAVFLLLGGVLSFEQAIHAIDFEILVLLIGLMLVVAMAEKSGVFDWLNARIAKMSKGSPLAIFVLFSLLTFIASPILDNATVIILIIPVALALTKGLGLNSKLMVIVLAMFSNIGGTLTLIGDPPNTLIGLQANLSFFEFIENLWVPVLIMGAVVLVFIVVVNWKYLKPINGDLVMLFNSSLIIKRIRYLIESKKLDKYFVAVTLGVVGLTLIAFLLQGFLGVQIGLIALISGLVMSVLLFNKISFVDLVKEVSWDSILFFIGLFIQVAALREVGFLTMIADFIIGFSADFTMLLMVIVWGIGLASAFINNIPFVALMIPVIFDLQARMTGEPNLDLLWWALALGACLGGNFTSIGSSAGILALDIAKKNGVKVSFWEYAKIGVPVTLICLIISSAYLIVRVNT